ncbi:hypothetical protein ATANTOWER_024744 [Ataeniobius toweri]|uniref:Uncharacterized protein n=1 Tax=Ataeniobius toweri TaxID=208326 RepID=A0ABU7BKX9_9TELE|nr:hypothetical protein [Ataeniobius toweri]
MCSGLNSLQNLISLNCLPLRPYCMSDCSFIFKMKENLQKVENVFPAVLSKTSRRCTDPEHPIRAQTLWLCSSADSAFLIFDFAFTLHSDWILMNIEQVSLIGQQTHTLSHLQVTH